jgi:fructan beta-fructosidase
MKKLSAFILFSILVGGQLLSQTKKKIFKIEHQYINIPIEEKENRQYVNLIVDDKVYTYNDIRVANANVDYWTFIDVSKYLGKNFTLEFSQDVPGIEKIYQSDQFKGQEKLYNEELRPQLHFTTRRGWTNDPNGMVYYKGEYHLFYQHNPYEINWGNMTWGHSVSKDLIHWKELPIALEPDELGTIFSGSAVIDYKNSSGFKKGSEDVMVVTYTNHLKDEKQQQSMAYSLDRGRTFTKYEGNPVIPAQRRFGSGHERDPKVFWYEPGNHWVLVMHDALNYSIYNSKNLKDWEYQSSVDAGFWECPELFELAIDGDENNKKWILYGVQGTYLIGGFDGKVFTPETEMLRYSVGGMTAAQTFNNEPEGRRLQIGWGHAEFPGMPFKQAFTMVQEFKLKTTRNGLRLMIEPAKEIEKLYVKSHRFDNVLIGDVINKKLSNIKSSLLHIKATFEIVNDDSFGLDINGYKIKYDVPTNQLNGHFLPLQNKQLQLEIIVDKTLVEVYANGGLIYWFDDYNEGDLDNFKISLIRSKSSLNVDSKTLIKNLEIHELKSIWE